MFLMRIAHVFVYVCLCLPTLPLFVPFVLMTLSPFAFHEPRRENLETPGVLLTLFAFDSQRFSAIKAYRVTDECLCLEESALFSMGKSMCSSLVCFVCERRNLFVPPDILTACCGLSFLFSHSSDACKRPESFRFL